MYLVIYVHEKMNIHDKMYVYDIVYIEQQHTIIF